MILKPLKKNPLTPKYHIFLFSMKTLRNSTFLRHHSNWVTTKEEMWNNQMNNQWYSYEFMEKMTNLEQSKTRMILFLHSFTIT